MQNQQPRTAKELCDILDARNDMRGIRRLEDVLPDLMVPQIRLRAPNGEAMRGFSPRSEAIKMEEEFQGGHNVD